MGTRGEQENRLGSKKKEGLKNKLVKGDLRAIKDPTARLRRTVSGSFRLELFFLLSSL